MDPPLTSTEGKKQARFNKRAEAWVVLISSRKKRRRAGGGNRTRDLSFTRALLCL
jgi:hypothetical protein